MGELNKKSVSLFELAVPETELPDIKVKGTWLTES